MPSPMLIGGLVGALVLLVVLAVVLSGAKVPTAAELLAMTTEELVKVAPKTLAKVPAENLAALGLSQKHALVQAQVAALTDAQVDALIISLTPQQCGWLTQKQVEGIEVADVDDIVKDSVLAMLPWLLPAQKKVISDANVTLLGAALVPFLAQLTLTQIQALDNSVILGLVNEKLRVAAPNLARSQVEALDAAKVGVVADLLTAQQVGYVDDDALKALPYVPLSLIASKLSPSQIDLVWTSGDNISILYPNFSKDQVESITLSRFGELVSYDSAVYYLLLEGPGRVSWIHSSLITDDLCRNLLGNLSNSFPASVDELRERCTAAGFNY